MEAYVDRVAADMAAVRAWADAHGLLLSASADTLFFGGGTPSLLSPAQMRRLLFAVRNTFDLASDAEITVEAAPGQLEDDLLQTMLEGGVNRISLGVQSFVDAESRAVGRLHTAVQCRAEIDRLRAAGVPRLSVDLIAGLPLQTEESWRVSLDAVMDAGVEHVSVYMLEVDEESRLGNAVLQNARAVSQLAVLGQEARYHAAAVPNDDRCAELYAQACTTLEGAGLRQYEISNFARRGAASRHNCKYWERAPYLGFGLDAHSMLPDTGGGIVRFAETDNLEAYLDGGEEIALERVSRVEAFEEAVFLGLRLQQRVSLKRLRDDHAEVLVQDLEKRARALAGAGVMEVARDRLFLTDRGRAISSSVCGELLAVSRNASAPTCLAMQQRDVE